MVFILKNQWISLYLKMFLCNIAKKSVSSHILRGVLYLQSTNIDIYV